MKKLSITGFIAGITLTAFGGIIVFDSITGNLNNSNHKSIKTHAKSVKTEIRFVTGRLDINHSNNISDFFNGDFNYEKEKWKPEIKYTLEDKVGKLRIISTDNSGNRKYDDSDQSYWNLVFNKKIENELDIDLFAAEGDIDLSGCNLKGFSLNMKAGNINLDLNNTSVPYLNIKAIAGEANVDLDGKWENDLRANITGGVGELYLKLPSDISIKMEITGLLGDVSAPGFIRNGQNYTNKFYNETEYTLYIDIFAGIGNITVTME